MIAHSNYVRRNTTVMGAAFARSPVAPINALSSGTAGREWSPGVPTRIVVPPAAFAAFHL